MRRILATAITVLATIALVSCDDPSREAPSRASEYSVYDLESRWLDQRGVERTLGSLRGRPQLVSLVYTSCTSVCPITVSAMQVIERNVGEGAGYVLVSLDPARDSPARLADVASARGLSSQWTLLGGSESSVRELAALLGVKYRAVAGGEIDHSSALTVLDAEGRIVARFDQPDAIDRATESLRRLVADSANGH